MNAASESEISDVYMCVVCMCVRERENPLLVVGYWKLDIITGPSIGSSRVRGTNKRVALGLS
jgi:hypothetical protein